MSFLKIAILFLSLISCADGNKKTNSTEKPGHVGDADIEGIDEPVLSPTPTPAPSPTPPPGGTLVPAKPNAIPVVISTAVPGNANPETLSNYFPLAYKHNLKFYSYKISRSKVPEEAPTIIAGKLQIKIENKTTYEGQATWPIDFVKDNDAVYWGPGGSQNLRWHVVDYTNSTAGSFIWARGDERFKRDTSQGVQLERRFSYRSLENGKLPYMLLPKELKANPKNDGLVNAYTNRQNYPRCSSTDGKSCVLVDGGDHVSWFMGVRNAIIEVPGLGKREAKWVEYIELDLPGRANEEVTAPYTNDRNKACALRNEENPNYNYIGVREDWFFVKDVGPALILTRNVNNHGGSCIYEVTREPLNLDTADTVTFLIQHDNNGYDPSWDF